MNTRKAQPLFSKTTVLRWAHRSKPLIDNSEGHGLWQDGKVDQVRDTTPSGRQGFGV